MRRKQRKKDDIMYTKAHRPVFCRSVNIVPKKNQGASGYMNTTSYITYAQVEEYALKHYERYGTKTSFKTIVEYLFEHGHYQTGSPVLPSHIFWSYISDPAFFALLNELPVKNVFAAPSATQTGTTIMAEAIMPKDLEVYALKYIRYIVEKMHTHNFFEVNYVMSGKCKMIFENETRELSTGQLCIIAPHSRHDVTVDDGSIVLSLMLRQNTFETTFFKLLAQEDLLAAFFRSILYSRKESANYMLFSTDNSEDIRSAIKNIFMECHISDSYSNTCVISRIHLLFSLLLRRYYESIEFYDHQQSAGTRGSFAQVLQYIQSRYQTVTLEQLAEVFHYNPSYLSRLIKKNTGQTLLDILTNLKMSRASDLLLHTTLKIEEIAALSGYQSVDHFSRLFKKRNGMSPQKYRQTHVPK